MTIYLVKYQTRRREIVSVPQGDWLDKEIAVLAREDGWDALDQAFISCSGYDFRLKEVKIIGHVDIVATKSTLNLLR